MSLLAKNHRNIDSRFLEAITFGALWILLFASPIILGMKNGEEIDWNQILFVWRRFLPYLFLFLVNRFFFLPFLFFRGKAGLFLLTNALLILLIAFVLGFNSRQEDFHRGEPVRPRLETPPPDLPAYRMPPALRDRPQPPAPGRPPGRLPANLTFMLISLLMVGFETGMSISFRWVEEEKKRISKERESARSQLAFLRNQVSPHFLMNTLNNIHSLVELDQEKARDAIITLSRLMRHLLYDGEVEKIPIQKEFEFIRNYVELMRLRYGEQVEIQLNFPENVRDIEVPPMLFTSFIENAFRYGISSVNDSFVRIFFRIEPENLYFKVENSLASGKNQGMNSTGIGIENSRKRLDLLYGKRYQLDILSDDHFFNVSLRIPL